MQFTKKVIPTIWALGNIPAGSFLAWDGERRGCQSEGCLTKKFGNQPRKWPESVWWTCRKQEPMHRARSRSHILPITVSGFPSWNRHIRSTNVFLLDFAEKCICSSLPDEDLKIYFLLPSNIIKQSLIRFRHLKIFLVPSHAALPPNCIFDVSQPTNKQPRVNNQTNEQTTRAF